MWESDFNVYERGDISEWFWKHSAIFERFPRDILKIKKKR